MGYLNAVALILTIACALMALAVFAAYQRMLAKRARQDDLASFENSVTEIAAKVDAVLQHLTSGGSTPLPSEQASSLRERPPPPRVAAESVSPLPSTKGDIRDPESSIVDELEVRMPEFGDLAGSTISRVMVSVGDTVRVDDPLVKLESGNWAVELPSPAAGRVQEIKVAEGDRVSEGVLILLLEAAAAAAEAAASGTISSTPSSQASPAASEPRSS
jgi:biotin carboxyl carrier protein